MMRSIRQLLEEDKNRPYVPTASYDRLALDRLRLLDELPADDLAREDVRAAAITFGLLAVADAIRVEK